MKILFIQTGGTIDKDYPRSGKTYSFEISTPVAKKILKTANPSFDYRFIELFKKDSTDLTDADRRLLYQTCNDAEEEKIIITHGTDTMTTTAQVLDGVKDKTIIITGAIRPGRFSDSDASFNIGTAVAALSFASPGVYIAMSGHVVQWNRIRKNFDAGQFVRI